MDYWQKWSHAQLTQQYPLFQTSLRTLSLQNFSISNCGVVSWAAYATTEQYLHGISYNRGSVSGREPTGGGRRYWRLKKKTTETETHSPPPTVHPCKASGGRVPAKIWIPTNQIRATSPRAHVSREICARALQTSRGIKESRVAHRAIPVRVS